MTAPDAGHGYWEKNAKRYDLSMALLGGPLPRTATLCSEAVRGLHVLEVAAGTGLITAALARTAASVTATDYSGAMVEKLSERVAREGYRNVTCETADLYSLRFDSATFDVVVAANVLHLVPDLPAALTAIRRVLRPGGRLIVPTYCHDETFLSWLVSRLLQATGFPGKRRFTVEKLQQVIAGCDFEIICAAKVSGLMPIGYVEARVA